MPGPANVLFSRDEIRRRVRELGREITEDYAGRSPILVCVMKGIATATEAYATDTNRYPRVTSIEELRALIQPRYIKAMPIVDGWGHPYRYECGTPGTDACQEYIVGSGGKDGIFEHESLRDYPKPGGATQAFDCDLIYANGSFIQYPESMARGD